MPSHSAWGARFLSELARQYEVWIFTARDTSAVCTWVLNNDIWDYVAGVTSTKIPALVCVDDNAITFKGDYATTLEDIELHVPWWDNPLLGARHQQQLDVMRAKVLEDIVAEWSFETEAPVGSHPSTVAFGKALDRLWELSPGGTPSLTAGLMGLERGFAALERISRGRLDGGGHGYGHDCNTRLMQDTLIQLAVDAGTCLLAQRDEAWPDLLQQSWQLYLDKSVGYGDPFANVKASEAFGLEPIIGILVRMSDKLQHIRRWAETGLESVDDNFSDILVDACIGVAVLDA